MGVNTESSLESLYVRWRLPLLSHSFKITKSGEDAEDVVHDLFLKLLQGRLEIPREGAKNLWLPVRRASIDVYRRTKKFLPLLLDDNGELLNPPLDELDAERRYAAKELLLQVLPFLQEQGISPEAKGLPNAKRIALHRLRKRLKDWES